MTPTDAQQQQVLSTCAKPRTRRFRSPRCRPPGITFPRRRRFGARAERIRHTAHLRARQAGRRAPARARTPGHILDAALAQVAPMPTAVHLAITADCQAWVSVSAASIAVAFSGAVRLGGLRSRACRCSHGHHPSGCDTEAKGRRATLPQRHRSGVAGSLTRTPRRRAHRLERPCSLPIVRAYLGSA